VLDDPRHQAVLDWVTTAPAQRDPKTQSALADSLGVAPRTIRDWQARDDFRAAWKARVDALAGSPERTQMLLDQLFSDATDVFNDKRVQAAKLYFEVTKAISPPDINVNVTSRRAQDLTDDELSAMIAGGASELLSKRSGDV